MKILKTSEDLVNSAINKKLKFDEKLLFSNKALMNKDDEYLKKFINELDSMNKTINEFILFNN